MEEDAGKNIHDAHGDAQPRRLQPLRRAAARDRQRARPAQRRPRPAPTCARCARSCSTSRSATATWRKAASAATPTSRCARAARRTLGTKAEIKNMNSFRAVERAHRVRDRAPDRARSTPASASCRRRGCGTPTARRRARCAARRRRTTTATSPSPTCCRSWSTAAWVDEVRGALPELPAARGARFEREHGLPAYDADVLTAAQGRRRLLRGRRGRGRQPEGDGELGHERGAAHRARGEARRRARHPRLAAHPVPARRRSPVWSTRDDQPEHGQGPAAPTARAPAPIPKRWSRPRAWRR